MSVLSNIFKSETKKNWQQLADEIGGSFIEGEKWNSDKIISKYRNTTIEVDIFETGGRYSKTYTRITCPYITPVRVNLMFNISPENIFTYSGKLFGIKDIEIGDEQFDTLINLKSNQKELFLKFLGSKYFKNRLLAAFEGPEPNNILNTFRNTEFNLFIEDKDSYTYYQRVPARIFYIRILNLGIEEDIETLKLWLEICKITLDRLIEIGEAEDVSPDIQ
jgi:hypothetical protein